MSEEIKIIGAMAERYDEILSQGALEFIAGLHARFNETRKILLRKRQVRQTEFSRGKLPHFLPETKQVREARWTVAPIPQDLQDRRVEITGPVSRKMIINALNSGAKVFMADFEDATAPTWSNMMEGQINLKDRWAGKIDFTDPDKGKSYALKDRPAVLMVRPRGWHLEEEHVLIDGSAISGSLFDFGLYLFHNKDNLANQNTGPYFYLPKLESHLEARLWNDVFVYGQEKLKLASGTIKATVLIETLPAAFEMDEILYELKDHIVGLNCGRWDYIFSFIKTLQDHERFILPDRAQVGMDRAFLLAYSRLLIKTCHRRGAFAMGGMAAAIPNRRDQAANALAFERVAADKRREAENGHDGTWVAHPDLVPVALKIFDDIMPQPNQLSRKCEDYDISQADLLEIHDGLKTENGLRENIRVGVQYIEAWLRGVGAVPLYNLMEDAATAEISRAQVWQLLKFNAELEGGRRVDKAFVTHLVSEEMQRIKSELGEDVFEGGRFEDAEELFKKLIFTDSFETFLKIGRAHV